MTVTAPIERIFESPEALAQTVAEWLCGLAQASGGPFSVCLSGGSTLRRMYERLATPAIASRFPWPRVHWLWGDKRFVADNDPASNCSALKRRYRDVLIGDRTVVRLVHLKGDETLIARRIAIRHEHFMPQSLLHSQSEALEEPGPDEGPITVSIEPQPHAIVARCDSVGHGFGILE